MPPTRSAIARPRDGGWIGVYHHWDGYPSGLGRVLWAALHQTYRGDVQRLRAAVIDDHPGGWSSFPTARCYCHDPSRRGEPPMAPLTETDAEPLWIEWVYVLGDHVLTVLASVPRQDQDGREGWGWVVVAQVPWGDPEPDWLAMETAPDGGMEVAG